MTSPPSPAPDPPLRTAWLLLVVVACCILWLDRANASRDDLPPRSTPDRSREARSVDILEASMGELQFLPGVGVGIARSVHRSIRERSIRSLDALESLPGIGPVRAEAMRRAVAGGGHD